MSHVVNDYLLANFRPRCKTACISGKATMKKKIGSILAGIFMATFLHAQETVMMAGTNWDSVSDLDVMLQAIQALPTVPADSVAGSGNFYSLQHAPGTRNAWPPLPCNARNAPLWDLGNSMYLMDDLGIDYSAPLYKASISKTSANNSTLQANDLPFPSGGGGGGDGSGDEPNFPTLPDYGTNLWLAITNLDQTTAYLKLSNTVADIQYEIQYKTDLVAQTDWQSANWFAFGSELTNWTPYNAVGVGPTNLFFRVRSWQDDGSGLPLWWQLEYFGTNGVDPYGDPAGDGWNNLQKFQNGMNPNVSYTPPAPQGVTVNYNSANNTAAISWRGSSGSVSGYTVTRNNNGTITTFNFSSGTTGFTDSTIPSETPDLSSEDASPVLPNPTYTIQAHYSGGDSQSSISINLLNKQNTTGAAIVANGQGATLVVSSLPPQATGLRLMRLGPWNLEHNPTGDTIATNFDIPASSFNSGTYSLSNSQFVPPNGEGYSWYVQTLYGNDQSDLGSLSSIASTNAPPFYDGRRQLKDDLIFLLREPDGQNYFIAYPFQAILLDSNGVATNVVTTPGNYAYSSYYGAGFGDFSTPADALNVFRPFQDNYFCRNFVFNTDDLDQNGNLTTGVGQYGDYYGYLGLTLQNPAYQFQPSLGQTNIPSLLSDAQYVISFPFLPDDTESDMENIGITYNWVGDTETMIFYLTGVTNYWGLPYLSAHYSYYSVDNNQMVNGNVSVGDSFTAQDYDLPIICPAPAMPQFQTVEYDLWNTTGIYNNQGYIPPSLPGDSNFSPTNQSAIMIVSLGVPTQIACFAKLAVTNGNPNVYAYLGQYLDAAYIEDTDGNITDNSAGFLTPYGSFFPTSVGRAALVTMPDLDTGERGTNTIYVVALKLDVNHDGQMDMSWTGPDNTSANRPYVFWCNNNFDRWKTTSTLLYSETEQDDVLQYDSDSQNLDPGEPDYDYKDNHGDRIIPDTRDLEDFARLWICGVDSNLLTALPTNSTITLSWNSYWDGYQWRNDGYPTIDLFQAADADGGIGYLTNEATANAQIDPNQSSYLGRLAPGGSIQLNTSQFANNWAGNYFVWCGVSNGIGALTLTIQDGNGNFLGQSTAYIQIKDIKDMYERWTVGDDPNQEPLTVATNAYNDLPTGEMPFQYPTNTDANMPYILFVHGFNMTPYDKDRFAETEFKRLYWQGYQGRFGEFRWPTTVQTLTYIRAFDDSELNAWKSGAGLLNLLTNLNSKYPGNVYLTAHSHGNVVAGEALRLATNQVVNTYIAMQGAVDSHTYDATTPIRLVSFSTPDCYGQYYTDGATNYFAGSAGAGTYVNFFNTNDYALGATVWQRDQNLKPDADYFYNSSSNSFYQLLSISPPITQDFYFPQDTYTIFSYCDQAHGYALGAQLNVAGAFLTGTNYNQVELDADPFDWGTTHIYHSAEFRSDYAQRWLFWDEVLVKIKLKPNL